MTTTKKGIRPGEPDQTGDLPADPAPATAKTTPAPARDMKDRQNAQSKTEGQMDDALDDTFPASDPPAHSTPVRTGTHRPPGQ